MAHDSVTTYLRNSLTSNNVQSQMQVFILVALRDCPSGPEFVEIFSDEESAQKYIEEHTTPIQYFKYEIIERTLYI